MSEEFELWIDDKRWALEVTSEEEPFVDLPVLLRSHDVSRQYTLRITPRGMQLTGASGRKLESWWRKA